MPNFAVVLIGVTISFAEHQDAYTHFNVQPDNEAMSQAAAAAGYDSVQFLAHVDHTNYQCDTYNTGRPGFDYMGLEVVAVKLVGTYPCGASTGAPASIRSGWGATQPCTCDSKQQFLNCKGVAYEVPPVGGAAAEAAAAAVLARTDRVAAVRAARLYMQRNATRHTMPSSVPAL